MGSNKMYPNGNLRVEIEDRILKLSSFRTRNFKSSDLELSELSRG
jgi:hypothetical protein